MPIERIHHQQISTKTRKVTDLLKGMCTSCGFKMPLYERLNMGFSKDSSTEEARHCSKMLL